MNHKKLASKLSSVCLPTQTSTESFCNVITIHRCKRFIECIWWLGPWVCFPMFTLALHFIASSEHSPLKMIRNEFAYQIIQRIDNESFIVGTCRQPISNYKVTNLLYIDSTWKTKRTLSFCLSSLSFSAQQHNFPIVLFV